jgi:hypothetical protein
VQNWLSMYTVKTRREFKDAGGKVTGFRASRWEHIRTGDIMLCYVVGAHRWVGMLEVVGEPYFSEEPRIWEDDLFPARLPVRILKDVALEVSSPIEDMLDSLTAVQGLENKKRWGTLFLGSPARFVPDRV